MLSAVLVGGIVPPGAIAAVAASPSVVAQNLDIQATAEQFVDSLAVDDIESAHNLLNPLVQKDWSEDMMQQSWQDLLAVTGEFQERLGSQVEGQVVLVTVEFESVTNDVIVIFDESGQIIGFDFPKMEG
ncbi:MAG: DUF3887 domain-containing protein [Geitlerinemataceae cyanobacterium]